MRTELISIALVLISGCAPEAPQVKTNLSIAALKAAEPKSSRADVTMNVRVVGYTELNENKGLLARVMWREVDRGQTYSAGEGGYRPGSGGTRAPGVERTGIVPVVPVPAFIVRVVNHSKKTLDFSSAQLQLVDDKGRHFDIYADLGEVTGRVEGDIMIRFPKMQEQREQLERIREIVTKETVLTKKTRIEPGVDWQGYLLFKMDPRTPAELEKYLAGVAKLTVQLSGIGGDTQPASIEIPIEKATGTLPVSCPGNKPQSMDNCTPQPLEP